MDVVRAGGGGNYIEAVAGYTGLGVIGEIVDLKNPMTNRQGHPESNHEAITGRCSGGSSPGAQCNHDLFCTGGVCKGTPIAHHPNYFSEFTDHATMCYGVVFGRETDWPYGYAGLSPAKGMLPEGQGIYTDWCEFPEMYPAAELSCKSEAGELPPASVARACSMCELVCSDCAAECGQEEICGVGYQPGSDVPYRAVFQNNSWGNPGSVGYDNWSASLDLMLLKFDILTCQIQGNEGRSGTSRSQAWAKNTVSVGGVYHWDTENMGDDMFDPGAGGLASYGPAHDQRIKPDFVHFHNLVTSPWAYGPPEYSDYNWNAGGTSVATPITCGHFGLFFQMWADDPDADGSGPFANLLTDPECDPEEKNCVFENKPHAATAKAMMINTATPYVFSDLDVPNPPAPNPDLTRDKQGWGLPNVGRLYALRNRFPLIVDETLALEELESRFFGVAVPSNTAALRVTMVYTDPPGQEAPAPSVVNDLNLKVTPPPPSELVYWGNCGLFASNWSSPDCAGANHPHPSDPNDEVKDNVENVFVPDATAGTWTVTVTAETITQDGHLETPDVDDVDFALVVSVDFDCNDNGELDSVEIGLGDAQDCNDNDVLDECDIDAGTSQDVNGNGIPDECDILLVDKRATGVQDGLTWETAYRSPKKALAAAVLWGHTPEIWVAEGTYKPYDGDQLPIERTATFQMIDSVPLYGGFLGVAHPNGGESSRDERNPGLHETILSGDLDGDDMTVTCTQDSPDCDSYGGWCVDGSCIHRQNISENSYHVVTGAGENTVTILDGFTIADSNANASAGKDTRGGGMVTGSGTVIVRNCTFRDNHATTTGGGMEIAESTATIMNSVFKRNTAGTDGAGVYASRSTVNLINCSLYGNLAYGKCGGVRIHSGLDAAATNCILWGNKDDDPETTTESEQLSGTATVTSSCIDDGEPGDGIIPFGGAGHNNIDGPPGFAGAPDDLRLETASPCIDTGNKNVVTLDEDHDGNARIVDGNGDDVADVDMGAYEYQPSTFYVDWDVQGGTASGGDWPNAMPSLQTALGLAEIGDRILVAEGTYTPDDGTPDRSATFQLKSGVHIYGGFASGDDFSERDPATKVTVLSGDLMGDDGPDFTNINDNSYHVVTGSGADSTAVLDGLTITAGNAEGASAGGGLYNVSGSPRLTRCIFRGNSGPSAGAVFNDGSSPTFSNCLFSDNRATGSPSGGKGATILNDTLSNPVLINCTLSQNHAPAGNGGGIYNANDAAPVLTNCIVWGNSDSTGTGAPAQMSSESGTPVVSYSCIQDDDPDDGSVYPGTGNIDDDPQFLAGDGEDADLHVYASSPCIETGDDSVVTVDTDLDGNPRQHDADGDTEETVDMGAYEYDCLVVEVPAEPSGEAGYAKNRYISFVPGHAGQLVAIRVTLTGTALDGQEFQEAVGSQWWVGEPVRYCENGGQAEAPDPDNPPNYGCGPAPGLPSRTFMGAPLVCTPYVADWDALLGSGVALHVFGDVINAPDGSWVVPASTYEVQAIHVDCDPGNEDNFSAPLVVTTSIWGDVAGGPPSGGQWPPPDGSVDIATDVTAVLDKFKNLEGAPIKARCDVEPNVVDQKVNISDVLCIHGAFQGQGYPFEAPSPCP